MPVNRTTGWTAASLIPRTTQQVHTDAASASTPLGPLQTSVGTPAAPSLDPFRTTPQTLVDPALGSRAFRSTPNNVPLDVAATSSVYATPNAPAFLTGAVDRLNSQQSARQRFQNDLLQQLFYGVMSGGPNAYLLAPALAAAVAQPGASIGLPGLMDPGLAKSQSDLAAQRAEMLKTQNDAANQIKQRQQQTELLLSRRKALGDAPMGFYQGSEQEKLDQQLTQLRSGSGWTPAVPRY